MGSKAKLAERIIYASKAAKIAKASRLGIIASALLSFMIFAISYYGETVGNFTFSVDRLALEAGITLNETIDGEDVTRLTAPRVDSADGMTSLCGTEYSRYLPGDDVCIPSDETVSSVDGNNSGESYLVYTFYVVNAGDIGVDLSAIIDVKSASKGAEEALRLRVIFEGVGFDYYSATTYARAQTSRGANPGEAEPLTEMFYTPTQILNRNLANIADYGFLQPKDALRVTIVLWLEGEDADHNLNIVGGGFKLAMEFTVSDTYEKF